MGKRKIKPWQNKYSPPMECRRIWVWGSGFRVPARTHLRKPQISHLSDRRDDSSTTPRTQRKHCCCASPGRLRKSLPLSFHLDRQHHPPTPPAWITTVRAVANGAEADTRLGHQWQIGSVLCNEITQNSKHTPGRQSMQTPDGWTILKKPFSTQVFLYFIFSPNSPNRPQS